MSEQCQICLKEITEQSHNESPLCAPCYEKFKRELEVLAQVFSSVKKTETNNSHILSELTKRLENV